MQVSTYTLAGHRHRTMRPGSGTAPHRTINMQADTNPRPRLTTGRTNMQAASPIAISRPRSPQDAIGHPRRYLARNIAYMG